MWKSGTFSFWLPDSKKFSQRRGFIADAILWLLIVLVTALAARAANAGTIHMDTSTLPGTDNTAAVGDTFSGNILNGATPVDTWSLKLTGLQSPGFFAMAGNTIGGIGPGVNAGSTNFVKFNVSFGTTWSGISIYSDGTSVGGFFTTDDRQTYTLTGGAVWNVISNDPGVTIVGAGTNTISLTTSVNEAMFRIAPSGPINGFTEEYDNLNSTSRNGTTSYVDFSSASQVGVIGPGGTGVPEPGSLTLLGFCIAGLAGYRWRRWKQPTING